MGTNGLIKFRQSLITKTAVSYQFLILLWLNENISLNVKERNENKKRRTILRRLTMLHKLQVKNTCKAEAYLEPSKTSTIEVFCENS